MQPSHFLRFPPINATNAISSDGVALRQISSPTISPKPPLQNWTCLMTFLCLRNDVAWCTTLDCVHFYQVTGASAEFMMGRSYGKVLRHTVPLFHMVCSIYSCYWNFIDSQWPHNPNWRHKSFSFPWSRVLLMFSRPSTVSCLSSWTCSLSLRPVLFHPPRLLTGCSDSVAIGSLPIQNFISLSTPLTRCFKICLEWFS